MLQISYYQLNQPLQKVLHPKRVYFGGQRITQWKAACRDSAATQYQVKFVQGPVSSSCVETSGSDRPPLNLYNLFNTVIPACLEPEPSDLRRWMPASAGMTCIFRTAMYLRRHVEQYGSIHVSTTFELTFIYSLKHRRSGMFLAGTQ